MIKILFIFLFSFSLISAKKPKKTPDEKCDPAGPQSEMNRCAYLDYQKADAKLNKVYKQAVKSSDAKKLLKVQRAWLKYRDLHCQYKADLYKGGSMVPLIQNRCLEKLTITRIKQLNYYMDP